MLVAMDASSPPPIAGPDLDPRSAGELLPLVDDALRRIAASKLAGERPSNTLQPTALVHEAWLRLGLTSAAFGLSARSACARVQGCHNRLTRDNGRRQHQAQHVIG